MAQTCDNTAQVAEQRATEAEEEQLKTEQELVAVRADLASSQQNGFASGQTEQNQQLSALSQQLYTAQAHAENLQTKLAAAEMQITFNEQQFASASQHSMTQQLGATGQSKGNKLHLQLPAASMLSQEQGTATFHAGASSDSLASDRETALQVSKSFC